MPFPPADDPALQALAHVAAVAAATCGIPIELVPQHDSQVCWDAAAVHPMQALETGYQAIVRDAERRQIDEPSPLAAFFFLEAGPPRLLGVERDRPYRGEPFPLPADRLRHATVAVDVVADMVALGMPAELVSPHVADARAAAMRVYRLFAPPAGPAAPAVPAELARVAALIQARGSLGDVLTDLRHALALLRAALVGRASVQMLYVIEPFYLSRLLVRYRLRAVHPMTKADARVASGALTAVLNRQPWLIRWLEEAIVGLEAAIRAVDPHGHTRFFLKGGRALAYFNGVPAQGGNDWDTQVLIDPNLSPGDWYALYRDVSNAVLLHLLALKNAFFSRLAANVAAVQAIPMPPAPDPVAAAALDEADDAEDWAEFDETVDLSQYIGPGFQYPCKAELIDVGMPRRDTIELREQWAELHDGIGRSPLLHPRPDLATMPIPGGAYYVGEYILMIREFFAGEGASAAKTAQRIVRLATMLRDGQAANVVVAAMLDLPAIVRDIVADRLAGFLAHSYPDAARRPASDTAYVLLDQFATAHAMQAEPEFTTQFARYYVQQLGQAPPPARYTPAFRDALPADTRAMAEAIGFADTIADRLADHAAARAALIAASRPRIEAFLRDLSGRMVWGEPDEYELQLAIGGSFAATLQAEYHRAPNGDLEPIALITVGLYHAAGIDDRTVIELVTPIVTACLAGYPELQMIGGDPAALRLFWPDPQTLRPFGPYRPMVIEIVPIVMRERPLVSLIRTLPVLGLRDLIVEYQQRAAHIVEFRRRSELRTTAALLTDMLMAARA